MTSRGQSDEQVAFTDRGLRSRYSRKSAQGGILWRHLIGDYSLARSYWLHMVVFGWCLDASHGLGADRPG